MANCTDDPAEISNRPQLKRRRSVKRFVANATRPEEDIGKSFPNLLYTSAVCHNLVWRCRSCLARRTRFAYGGLSSHIAARASPWEDEHMRRTELEINQQDMWRMLVFEQRMTLTLAVEMLLRCQLSPEQILIKTATALEGSYYDS